MVAKTHRRGEQMDRNIFSLIKFGRSSRVVPKSVPHSCICLFFRPPRRRLRDLPMPFVTGTGNSFHGTFVIRRRITCLLFAFYSFTVESMKRSRHKTVTENHRSDGVIVRMDEDQSGLGEGLHERRRRERHLSRRRRDASLLRCR